MGKIEIEALRERRKGYLQEAVLYAVGIAGILLVTMAAPNTLRLLGGLMLSNRRFSEQARAALSRLARKGYIEFEESHGKKYARITSSGRRVLELERQKLLMRPSKGKRWDRRFRMVMFDIAEKRKAIRIQFREAMREAGFLRLQDSVWVYPYNCDDFIQLLKADLHLGREVLYVIVEKMDNDAWVRKHFKLPPA